MDWAYALSQGAAAGAGAVASLADTQIKEDAEKRAADLKLDTAQRLLAIQDAMKNRAAERFSAVVKDKMGQPVPVDAPAVSDTGLTADGAQAAGLETGVQGSSDTVKQIAQQAKDTLLNPQASAEQKADARGVLAQLEQQMAGQGKANAASVAGKTRMPTIDDATKAALDDTLQNDAVAYQAGSGMLAASRKTDIEQAKLDSKERIAQQSNDRKERADNLRFEAMMSRIEAASGGSKAGNAPAMVQTLEYLKNSMGWSQDQLNNYITDKKRVPVEDIAAKLLTADKFGEMTPDQAMEKALALQQAQEKYQAAGKNTGTGAMPDGKTSISAPKSLTFDPKTRTFIPAK